MNRSHYPGIDKLWRFDGTAEAFLRERLGDAACNELIARELVAVEKAGCAADLVAALFIRAALGVRYRYAVGMGSLAGSLVANRLRLSCVDPIKYGICTPLSSPLLFHVSPDGIGEVASALKGRLGDRCVALRPGTSPRTPHELYLADTSIRDLVPCDWGRNRTLNIPSPLRSGGHGMLRIDLMPSKLVAALEQQTAAVYNGERFLKALDGVPDNDSATFDYLNSPAGKEMLDEYAGYTPEGDTPLHTFEDFVGCVSNGEQRTVPRCSTAHAASIARQLWCLAYLKAHY